MTESGAPKGRGRDPENGEVGENGDALDDDRSLLGDSRHYLHDPDGLLEHERDEDEREDDDKLELDQTELEELGLVLDDPHQPEPE